MPKNRGAKGSELRGDCQLMAKRGRLNAIEEVAGGRVARKYGIGC